jgi:hypothetical protein
MYSFVKYVIIRKNLVVGSQRRFLISDWIKRNTHAEGRYITDVRTGV